MSNVDNWDTRADDNNDAPPDGFPEGMAPSAVNNAAREVMAAVARYFQTVSGTVESSGNGGSYTVVIQADSFAAGRVLRWLAHANNTENPNLTLSGPSSVAGRIKDTLGETLPADTIRDGDYVETVWTGAEWRLLNARNLLQQISAASAGGLEISDTDEIGIADDGVTLAMMAGGTADRLLGYDGSGDPAEVSEINLPVQPSGAGFTLTKITLASTDPVVGDLQDGELYLKY